MKLFEKISKKSTALQGNWKEKTVLCPLKGTVIPLEDVADPGFAGGMLGRGVGIEPIDGILYAPVNGMVSAVFPTGHAIGLTSEDGMELLIHIGIDTVQMGGKGFTVLVKQDRKVKAGEPLICFDIQEIKAQGYMATTMVLVTNPDEIGSFEPGNYGSGEPMQELYSFQ